MIDLKIWDRLYRHSTDWVLRRMEPDCLEIYKDKQQDWVDALLAFNKVQEELFKNYAVTYKTKKRSKYIKGLELTAEQLFDLFHKHLNQYTNKTVRDYIFHWWNDLRGYVEGAEPPLDQPWIFNKPATKEEIEQARKNFGHIEGQDEHTFPDDAWVLEYRGQRFIIDKEWGDAWTIDKNGKVRSFQLEWDWWYPIDRYLDLENI